MKNPGEVLYLSRRDVESVGLPMADIVEATEEVFIAKGSGKTEMPPKPGIHTREDSFIHAMPAYVEPAEAAGLKWVAGYPSNTSRDLPYISGLIILNDPDTGLPLVVMDATWITAMRTGAATAVAARYLARAGSRSLAILGCGVQGRSNLEALMEVLQGLERVLAYSTRVESAQQFSRECQEKYDLPCTVCDSPLEAVRAADVIVTAGPPIVRNPSPVILPDWIQEGAFICTLDYDSYLTPAAMHAADSFVTDDVEQLRYYKSGGYFAGVPEHPLELAEIVCAHKPGRQSETERIASVHLGLALEDVVTARLICRRASEMGVGTHLQL